MGKTYDKMETASLDEIQAYQLDGLQKTVKHIYEHVPFYRSKLDDLGILPEDIHSLDDIQKLPFTYKQDLRDTYPFGMFAVPKKQVARIHASSGTTGKPVVSGYTQNDLDMWGRCCARAITAAGGSAADSIHISYGYGLFTGGLGLHEGARILGATCIPVSSGNTQRQVRILQDFGSDILACTPSYAAYIGETVRELGIDPHTLPLRAGIFGAEPWTEEMRHEIEELLDIKAYDIYGLTEVMGPGVSYECEEQHGMHVNEDYFFVEVIDPATGRQLPEGEQGELVFTSLRKEAFPIIRYRTRDLCRLSRRPCSCGRNFIRMEKPQGRTDDMLIIRGVNVFPSEVESVLMQFDNIAPVYQIIVDRVGALDTLEILIEMKEGFAFDVVRAVEAQERKITAALQSTLQISPKVRLVSPKTIKRSEGKAVRVIDNRKLYK